MFGKLTYHITLIHYIKVLWSYYYVWILLNVSTFFLYCTILKKIKVLIMSEWVSDYCLMPNEQFFKYPVYHGQTRVSFWCDDDVLDQQAVLDFSKASSLNNPWIDMFIEPMICPTRDKHTMDAVTDYDYSNYFHLTKNTC
jgi:hypothetical protein